MAKNPDFRDLVGSELLKHITNTTGMCTYTDQTHFNHILENKMFMLNINIRGLLQNVDSLREYLDLSHTNNIKLITATEIFNACSTFKSNYLPGYNYISKIRKVNPQRGGVGIFIHNNLKYTETDFSHSCTLPGVTMTCLGNSPLLNCLYTLWLSLLIDDIINEEHEIFFI